MCGQTIDSQEKTSYDLRLSQDDILQVFCDKAPYGEERVLVVFKSFGHFENGRFGRLTLTALNL